MRGRAGGCELGGFGRDFGGRVESWRGEGGEAADAGAIVKACPQKNEGGRMGRRKERSAAGPIRDSVRDRRSGGREPGSFGRDFGGQVESWKGEGGDAADAGAVAGSCPHKSVRGGGGVGGWEVAQREPIRGLT